MTWSTAYNTFPFIVTTVGRDSVVLRIKRSSPKRGYCTCTVVAGLVWSAQISLKAGVLTIKAWCTYVSCMCLRVSSNEDPRGSVTRTFVTRSYTQTSRKAFTSMVTVSVKKESTLHCPDVFLVSFFITLGSWSDLPGCL